VAAPVTILAYRNRRADLRAPPLRDLDARFNLKPHNALPV
jgi:hypothetical protein